jgi:hypothetical protein
MPLAATEPLATNARRLAAVRLAARVTPGALNQAVAPDGRLEALAGQGGVVTGIGLGDRGLGWVGDHVEPGVSLADPDPLVNRAIQVLSCVGNRVAVLDGPAAGAEGMVYGKHGAVLAMLPPAALARIAPGERVAIDAVGCGLAIEGRPDVACLSASPRLLERWLPGLDEGGRLIVPVRTVLPAEAAAAGIGMPSARFNMDLNSGEGEVEPLARDLAFGDLIAVADQDHRHGRRLQRGRLAIGVICHGRTIAGGHGLGFMTLLTGPREAFRLDPSGPASLAGLGLWGAEG